MKKIILLLSMYFVTANTFSQNIMFQENFEKGRLNEGWKTSWPWSVINLESKGIKPSPGGNNFALSSMGDGEITIDVAVKNNDPAIQTPLSFYYWVHSKGSKGTVSILFLKENGDSIVSVHFAELREKADWSLFNDGFKIPAEASVIRLKLGEIPAIPHGNTVYFQSICLGCKRRGP